MSTIISAAQFNPAALQASGFYVTIVNPPSYIRGVPTDVIGVVGTASWGPVNKAVHLGNGQDAVMNFGPMSAASLTDPYDIATDFFLAFQQSTSQANLEAWGVRVTDGTDTAASVALTGTATAVPATATVGGTITANDTITLTASGGVAAAVTYTVKSTDTLATIAAGLAALINANATLVAYGVFASSLAAVVTIYNPTATTVTWAKTIVGSTETVTIGTGAASSAGATVQMVYTGSGGNSASTNALMVISTGVKTATLNVALIPPYGGNSEIFAGLPSAGFWGALKSALNNGMSPARGPSHIAQIPGPANIAVGAPTTGNYSFTGGTDGRTGVVTATLLGSDTAQPRTGLYALRNLNPAVGITWITGCVDVAAASALLVFGQSESTSIYFPMPSGTTTAAAQTAVAANGIADPCFNYCKDWIYFYDTVNKVQRLVPPTAVIGGTWATYPPQNSPDNKPVNAVIGTERANPQTGNQPYTLSELGIIQSAGIAIITNPIPAGSTWGITGGRSTSVDPATQPSEYWRMTSYIARSLAGFGGKYVGALQSQQPNDPLRRQIKLELNNFFNFLYSLGQIDSLGSSGGQPAVVMCEFSTSPNVTAGFGWNTPASVSQHFMFAMCQVLYLSSVWFFVLSLQGGTTVSIQIVQAAPVSLAA